MNKSFLVDSNIIVYSIDNTCSFHHLANLIIRQCIADLYISIQNIAETYRVITDGKKVANPLQPRDAQKIIFQKIGNLRLLYPTDKTIKNALNLSVIEGITGLKFYDCMLAAVIIENNIDGVITENINDFRHHYDFLVMNLQETLKYI